LIEDLDESGKEVEKKDEENDEEKKVEIEQVEERKISRELKRYIGNREKQFDLSDEPVESKTK
jgi:hypothetical protein